MSDLSDDAHRRAMPRFKLFEPTEMIIAGQTSRVHILNISIGGALVHSAHPISREALVQLQCGAQIRSARVAWASGQRVGVAFNTPLQETDLKDLMAKGQ